MRCRILFGLLACWLVTSAPAFAEPGVEHGHDVFRHRCALCHGIKPGQRKPGPNLFGLVGRPAASGPDFHYSSALRNAGFTWTETAISDYLVAPMKVVPGGSMAVSLPDTNDRADVIAFLKSLK